jgi:HAD superfamily hydrolase (TIGR01509 family)
MKLVAFDLEGVLFNWKKGLDGFCDYLDIRPQIFHEFLTNNLNDLESGNLSAEQFWLKFSNEFEIEKTYDELQKLWVEGQPRYKFAWEYARKLKNQGIKIAICTNSWSGVVNTFFSIHPELKIFDFVFDSNIIGHTKPQPEYFKYVEKITSFRGKDILLIDDSEENVEGARDFGWNAQLIFDIVIK